MKNLDEINGGKIDDENSEFIFTFNMLVVNDKEERRRKRNRNVFLVFALLNHPF